MRAAVIEELNKPLIVKNVPDPECPPDGAILRTGANGICRTDWHLWTGDWAWRLAITPPFVLGHEFSGTIEEAGSEVRRWKKGDRVIFPMNPGEGACEWCMSGNQHICDSGSSLVPGVSYWGAFGEYVAVRYADVNLVQLPDRLSFADSAGMACRYMAAFRGVVDTAVVRGGEWVVVHGAGGGMGLSVVQIASAIGGRVIAVDVSDRALETARSLGAEHAIDGRDGNVVEHIHELTQGGAQVSIDALGIAETCRNSVLSLRKLGRHVQLGHMTQKEKGDVALPMDLVLLRELRLYGTFGMQGQRFGKMLAMCEAGILEPGKVVQRRVGLDGVTEILEAMGGYDTIGIVVIDRF